MQTNEHLVLCGGVEEPQVASEQSLRLALHGRSPNVRLQISDISRRLLANVPDVLADLLEVASYVYATDSAISRGGEIDAQMGRRWRRKFRFEIPVRLPSLWSSDPVLSALVETLSFLSDDSYEFEFRAIIDAPTMAEYFEFKDKEETAFTPDEVILFSGGLDSLSGTVEELAEYGSKKVALVSHRSASKIAGAQKGLVDKLRSRFGAKRVLHVPVWANLVGGLGKEPTPTTGWRVVEDPPVRFRRPAGMQPLPVPAPGGSVETLRSFLNVQSDADFVLVVAWALAVLRNHGPYPVIVLSGEQGSAKSTFSAILRSLLDPNTAPLRALPRENRDLFIAASNGHVLAFDNVSGLPAWISDTLCRLATGGGFAVRQLYTDQDEVLFDAARPVILNGIEDIVTRPDLADRAVFLTLEAIPEERRRPEAELWATFDAERPRILGALLDAAVQGLKMLPDTTLERLPRMADFALWATACETAIWPAGTFWSAYCANRDEVVDNVIEADPVAAAVPRGDGGADGVDGHGNGSSGRPCRISRGARRQVQDLARQPSGIVRTPPSGRDLPAQDRH